MVGAVIVVDGQIIGEGFHRCFGEAHAEVNVVASVKDETLLPRSTLYVNLEPCSHRGKTPPCVELIIQKKIPRVVVASSDPYPKVNGSGIKLLRAAGVEVETGVMEHEAAELNRFFMTAHRRQRPYIILKWAQSEDGFIDRKRKDSSEQPVVFSSSLTKMMVHRMRAEVQAIMVGTDTAIMDNPRLTVRYWPGKSPLRVLVDRHLRVPKESKLFDGEGQTVVFTEGGTSCKLVPGEMVAFLYKNDIHSLLVEGGATLHRSFLQENLWDELILETVPVRLKEGVKSALAAVCGNVQLVDRQLVYSGLPSDRKPSIIERYKNYTF
jgi:diaminohydroxyphosphoribosylaminopyrimidine deaminase/5-amino-6-(5-phosphoribosylamino)uracil reductase